jgi:transposase
MDNTMDTTNLMAENAALKAEVAELKSKLNWFMEQVKLSHKQRFGQSSEKSEYDFAQIMLFNEAEYFAESKAEEPELTTVKEHRRKTRLVTDKLPEGIPVEVIEHTLEDSELTCPECGEHMHRIGKETVREELKLVPAKAVLVRHVRYAYGCRKCEMEEEVPTIIKASVPKPVIKGGFASPEAVAHIMTQKFVMGVPLYRQEKELGRQGIKLSRQTMANWLIKCADDWLMPIYNRLHEKLLEREVLCADETVFQVLHEPGRIAQQKSYLWVYRTGNDSKPPIVLTDYRTGRGSEHPRRFLQGFTGYLHSDGWEVYHKLQDMTIVGCWAHARRLYDQALTALPEQSREGSAALLGKHYCDELFAIERKLADLSANERYLQRLALAKPLLDDYHNWLISFTDLGKNTFSKAVNYSLKQWQYLENYLLDGRLEISNNRTERTIKMFVIDRKNFMFANSPRGAKASAIIFSIIQTALDNGLNPYEYLTGILRHLPNSSLTDNLDTLDSILPLSYNWS